MKTRRRIATETCGGFTLMEVLITVIILSVGLLGVAGLQFGSLRGNQAAFHSSIAAYLAADAADRLRANVAGVRNPDTDAVRQEYDLITEAGVDPDCIESGCTYATLADHDAHEWITTIETQLPSGQGVICRDGTPYDGTGSDNHQCDGIADTNGTDVFAIKVWWDDDRNPDTPNVAYITSVVP
jgi:type IV pilus assembly protein PilV